MKAAYPKRGREHWWSECKFLTSLGLFCTATAAISLYTFSIARGVLNLILLAFCAWQAWYLWRQLPPRIRVFPYYDGCLPEADTYSHGYHLARNWGRLVRLGEASGAPALSHFGFDDPLRGEEQV